MPVLIVLGLPSCGVFDPCGNDVLARIRSPGGTHDAVVFQRDCGATTGFSTQLSLVRHGTSFREQPSFWSATDGGNVLVIDADHGVAPSGIGGGPTVDVEWQDDGHVTLTYYPLARVFKAESVVAGVAVRHVRGAQDR